MKLKMKLLSVSLISMVLLIGVIPVGALSESDDIAKQLICSCGCGKVVYDCYCDLAKEWRLRIDDMLEGGMSKQGIIDTFFEEYGDQVLATPAKSGLELVIWLGPVLIAVVGTLVIYRYAREKAEFPDDEIGFPIRERTETDSPEVVSVDESGLGYDELFYDKYRELKEKRQRDSEDE